MRNRLERIAQFRGGKNTEGQEQSVPDSVYLEEAAQVAQELKDLDAELEKLMTPEYPQYEDATLAEIRAGIGACIEQLRTGELSDTEKGVVLARYEQLNGQMMRMQLTTHIQQKMRVLAEHILQLLDQDEQAESYLKNLKPDEFAGFEE